MWSIWTIRTKIRNAGPKWSSKVYKPKHFKKAYKNLFLKTKTQNFKKYIADISKKSKAKDDTQKKWINQWIKSAHTNK